ncbi:uncharacterized protein [Oryza sativa Japonica Group]|uniref:uncharacterized protein isoform X3 n=1 Tax=Oryza sativa subsp. japonica TaxID=39947 RepID=UPI0007753E7F|nr:uncharacterized protein LOC4331786 isoform X3 [Oryza sativa Japonica Group]
MSRRIMNRESFNPPSLPNLAASRCWPESVILANRAYIADCKNPTTATAQSRDGHTVQISFCFAEAPVISYFCAHCYNPRVKVEFFTEPIIVAGEGAFVVLRVHLSSPLLSEFFIYRAGPGLPSLERVQDPTVYVYTSTTKTWSTRKLDLSPGIRAIRPQKVINLGRGLLGWVDLWHGILIFNARDEQPQIQYVPLPEPMPLNKESFRPSNRSESCPMLFRDVICSSSGEIKFVELEQRQRKIQPIPQELEDVRQESKEDVCDRDVLDDSYLMSCAHMDDLPKEETPSFVGDGWRAVTWSRLISSNCWQKGYVIDSDDMQSTYEVLTSTQRDKGVEMLRFRDLFSVFPTLSLNGAGDLLYLKSTVKFKDLNGWVSSIDIGKKTIKVLKPYCNGRHIPFVQMFRSCVLCHHLTVLPGPENIGRFIETSSNENHPKTIAASIMPESNCLAGNKRSRSATRWSPALRGWPSARVAKPALSWRSCPPSLSPVSSTYGLRNTAGYHMAQTCCFENDPRATANTTPRHPENQFTQHGYEQRENDFILSAPNFVRWHRPPFSAGGTLPPPPPTQQPSAFGTLPPPRPSQQFSACGTMLPPSSSQPFCPSVRSLAMQTFATPGPILPGPPVTPMQWPVFISPPQQQLSACAVWPQAGTLQQELPPHIPFRAHQCP